MNKKTAKLLMGFAVLMLISMLSAFMLNAIRGSAEQTSIQTSSSEPDAFTPTISKPAWVDQDNNGIADTLDREIADRTANGTAQNQVNVTVMLKDTPTTQDADDFASSGGFLTTSAWTEATYGFGGMITYDAIANFTRQCADVLLVEKEAFGEASIAYAAQQVGARTYVWNTLGLQGDPNSSIAFLDTGIDGSHPDFSPGYGDQDFSKKIVGWRDLLSGTAYANDDNGHGSHVAGLAAGNGFFSVDTSGNATTTLGYNLGSIPSSAWYFGCGVMVNKTGTISVNVKWTSTGTAGLSEANLDYGDKTLSTGSWITVASVNTPSQNAFYSVTYNVTSTPSGGYDMYHILLHATAGTGNLYVTFTMSWPYMPPTDGFSAWTGIAPQSKIVGVKVVDSTGSGSSIELIGGINWVISNKMTYHITVASMSVGFDSEVYLVDSAVQNLVNNGITTIVAAGNDGSGTNSVYTPGSVDEVITVAAMNQFDSITSYSSQGGNSKYTGATVKPDITTPGGSHYAAALFSADSNYNDAEGGFADIQANDSAPIQGTSMSTSVISGCAQVVIQAIGGYSNWNYTKKQALQPKMILLMTATETYPNLRETETSATSPTLNRGGKDIHEGYGRVNLDASVDALLKSYALGSVATDTLGRPPMLTDISVLGQKLVWARNVQLFSGINYNFSLSVPAGADYDLYLYNSTGTYYGEPAIVAKSINATTGGTEQLWVTAPYTGTYYIVVKRATENTGTGAFIVSSSGERRAPSISSFQDLVISSSANSAYFVYADPHRMTRAEATYDVASGSFVNGMCLNQQVLSFDTNPLIVLQDTTDRGRLLVSNKTVLMFGGPNPHWAVQYLEQCRLTPVYFQVESGPDGTHFKFIENSTGTAKVDRLLSDIDFEHEDYFVVMSLIDRNDNFVFVSYGFEWKGTWGAGIYIKANASSIQTYTNAYYIIHWVDTNEDGIIQPNEMSQVATGTG
jgi:hypothetical protein